MIVLGKMEETTNLAKFTRKWLRLYDSIRGKRRSEFPFPYWDVVAITTADEAQKKAYEMQLCKKQERKELPEDVDYVIISDMPGPKLGNGGSTFTALASLYDKYGDMLFDMKVLLLHAGGQSQRMPSASVLGKVFTAWPCGKPMYQVLDIKLANFIPFVSKMKAGVLLSCADDVEVYDVCGEEDKLRFDQPGFTVLAHPGSLEMGSGHGVYVTQRAQIYSDQLVQISECLEVLQKPSYERMKERGAHLTVLHSSQDPNLLNNGSSNSLSSPLVYTDSIFYFDSDTARKLLKFYNDNKPLTCEIDAYGDFLQCLGQNASIDYVNHTANVSQIQPDLIHMRKKVYHLLKDTPIHLIGLNQSRFIHIGTTKEMQFHFCDDSQLRGELNLVGDTFNLWSHCPSTGGEGGGDKLKKSEPRIQGCVMHSNLPSNSTIGKMSVVEFCNFDVSLNVGESSIISNCESLKDESDQVSVINIPSHLFLHTIALKGDNFSGFTTVVFDIFENLKKKASSLEAAEELPYMKKTLKQACAILGVPMASILPAEESLYNLWNCRLFPVSDSMTESFTLVLKTAQHFQNEKAHTLDLSTYKFVSMSDILKWKDIIAMLSYREKLYQQIHKSC